LKRLPIEQPVEACCLLTCGEILYLGEDGKIRMYSDGKVLAENVKNVYFQEICDLDFAYLNTSGIL
jgi:hypothetical protein